MRPDRKQKHATREFSARRAPTLAADLEMLLADLCIQWGFCNRLNGADLLDPNGILTAEAFAERVLTAEGMQAASEIKWRRAMKRAFTERYGRAEVSLRTYTHRE